MGHVEANQTYAHLQAKLDRMPVGAPENETIYKILKMLYTREDAELAVQMPLRLSSLNDLTRKLKQPAPALRHRLESMADRGLVVDLEVKGEMHYILAPTIVGFFEFSMMRVRQDIDQKRLAELFHRYLIEEPEFAAQFGGEVKTTLFRALVHEPTLDEEIATEVLDWERASQLVEEADKRSVGICHCRHVAHHRGSDCKNLPMEVCLSLNVGSDYLVRHGFARSIEKSEARDLMQRTREAGAVHICDNVQRKPAFICSCCGCCCEVLSSYRKHKIFHQSLCSNFRAMINSNTCTGCRKCEKACPVQAISTDDDLHVVNGKTFKLSSTVDHDVCIGCGVCALQCKFDSIEMASRPERRIAPANSAARIIATALERGKLSDLIVDGSLGWGANAAGLLVDAVLRLPPAKQMLARDGLKSRFLNFATECIRKASFKGTELL